MVWWSLFLTIVFVLASGKTVRVVPLSPYQEGVTSCYNMLHHMLSLRSGNGKDGTIMLVCYKKSLLQQRTQPQHRQISHILLTACSLLFVVMFSSCSFGPNRSAPPPE